MGAGRIGRAALAAALALAGLQPALAGGRGGGGHPGPMFRPGGGFHGFGGFRGGWGAGMRPGGPRGLPPISGVIRERGGLPAFGSAYGHTNTAIRYGGFGRGGGALYGHTGTALRFGGGFARPFAPGYGHTATSLRYGGFGRAGGALYGHLGTGLRYGEAGRGAERRFGALGAGRRLLGGRFAGGGFGGGYGGYGGFGDGFGAGLYGGLGTYGGQGTYGGVGTYGGQGTYGQTGTYGGAGAYAGQGDEGGGSYLSEPPLAARFAEPSLAPSPGAPYSPGDRYAYAASEDVGPGPRVVRVRRGFGAGCPCGAAPTFYRYGVGTAY